MAIQNCAKLILSLLFSGATFVVMAAENPFLGQWELTIPGGAAGWLSVEQRNGLPQGSMMWGTGSVVPVDSIKVEGDRLLLTRKYQVERTDASGKKSRVNLVDNISAKIEGDRLLLTSTKPDDNAQGRQKKESFSGKRQPVLPPAPDLSQVKFGEPINLFNGKDLMGWRLTDSSAVNGWSAKDGMLVNDPLQEDGKPHKNYGNLRTDREFEDFNIKLDVRLNKDQNSGIYLRGIYEVQVADTFGRPTSFQNMGAIYSRIKPSAAAEKPPGEWQTFDITLVQRHVTVELNGKKIIDNQPLMGSTGGALWSDVSKPGPIYFQGDHTAVSYRSIVLRSVVK